MAEQTLGELDWTELFSDPAALRERADAARERARGAGDTRTEARSLVALGVLECLNGIPEHAGDLFRRAEGLLEVAGDTPWLLRAKIGSALAGLAGPDGADQARRAEDLAGKRAELADVDRALVHFALADHAARNDRTGAALRHYYQALQFAQKAASPAFVIQIQNRLGTCQHGLGNLMEARLQLESALVVHEMHPSPLHAPVLASNLALVLAELGENEAAYEVMRTHRSGLDKVEPRNWGFIPAVSAFVAAKTGRLDEARAEMAVGERAVAPLAAADADSANLLRVQLLWTGALVDQAEGKLRPALAKVQKGLELLRQTPEQVYELNMLQLAAVLHAGVGDFQTAYRLQGAYVAMQRERQGSGARTLSLSLQIRHEVEETIRERDRAIQARDEATAAQAKLRELNAALESRLGEIEDLKRQLRDQAIRDSLTGLYNRPYLEEAMFGVMRQAHRAKKPLCVALLDVDGFRELNEAYGHSFADAVLAGLAEILLKGTRDSDIVSRYGGQEFCLVFADMEPDLVQRRIESMIEEFGRLELCSAGRELKGAAFSAGIVRFPTDAATFDQLATLADCAMNLAKERGGARAVCYASLVAVSAGA